MTVYTYFGLSAMFEDGLNALLADSPPTWSFKIKTTWQKEKPDREVDLVAQLSPQVRFLTPVLVLTVASTREELRPALFA